MGFFDLFVMEIFGFGFVCYLLYEKSMLWKMSREDYLFIKIYFE